MIRAVFLDAGGTLLHAFPSVGAVYADVARTYGVHVEPEAMNERFTRVWKERKKERQAINRAWWKEVVSATFDGLPLTDPEAFFDDVYVAFADPSRWRVFPDVIPALAELKKRGKRLAIVSNWDERLPILLDALGLSSYFERQYVSHQVGLIKPDPGIFLHALADMHVSPLEAIHVGDDEEEDVKAAEAAGIRAYHLRRGQRPLNSRQMTDFGEILVRV